MSRSSEPGERAQHSVAELLARYGEATPSTTGRRRRRDSDDGDTAPQSIIQRVQTDSGPLPATGRAARRRAAEPEPSGYDGGYSGYPSPSNGFGTGTSNGYAGSSNGSSSGLSNGSSSGLPDADSFSWSNDYTSNGYGSTGYSWGSLDGSTDTTRGDENRAETRGWSNLGSGHQNGSGWTNLGDSDLNGSRNGLNSSSRSDLNGLNGGSHRDNGLNGSRGDLNGGARSDLNGSRSDLNMRGPGPAAVDGRGRSELSGRSSSGPEADTYRTRTGREQDSWGAQPPLGGRLDALGTRSRPDGPSTEQFPRLGPPLDSAATAAASAAAAASAPAPPAPADSAPTEAAPAEPMSTRAWQPATGLATGLTEAPPPPPPALGRRSRAGEPPAGLGPSTQAMPRPDTDDQVDEDAAVADVLENQDGADYDLGVDLQDEEELEEYGSPVREWAVMVTQIGVGVIGGAGLWLICEWLWRSIPVVALVVALAVITGLVWVVRRVRKADDLQTTVIAVLVGLFVTVSPAALLLVGK
jgi:hypothetical protein